MARMPRDLGRFPGQVLVPNTVQVRLVWTLGGRTPPVYNVLHASVLTGFAATGAVATAVLTAISGSASWTAYKVLLPPLTVLVSVDLRDLRTLNQPLVDATHASNPGTSASAALPYGEAYAVTLRTAFAGRSFRGRVFLPGWATNAVGANGLVVAGNDTLAVNFVTAVQTAMAGQGLTLAIWQPPRQAYVSAKGVSHPLRGTLGPPPTGLAPVTVTQIVGRELIMDHQRRRAGRT